MTLRHIVLFQFNPTLSGKDLANIMHAIANLKNLIPQVQSFSWGKNTSIENLHKGYLHGFVIEFENEANRKTYLDHPEHTKVVDMILPNLVDGKNSVIVFDYIV